MPTVTDPEKDGKTESIWQKVDAVVQLVLENDRYLQKKRIPELTKLVMEKYKIQTRTAQKYIAEAKKEINKMAKQKKNSAFIRAIRDREFLLNKTKVGNKADFKLALEIMKDRDKLFGLYSDIVEHKGTISLKGYNLTKLTKEQLLIVKAMILREEDPRPYLTSLGLYDTNS